MKHFKLFIIFIVIVLTNCGSTKSHINYNEVKQGRQLDLIEEIDLNTFIPVWMTKRREKRGDNVRILYKDSSYTYLWQRVPKFSHDDFKYYKISNSNLKKADYESIKGDSIWDVIFNNYIYSDIKEAQKSPEFPSAHTAHPKITYKYLGQEQAIEILWRLRLTKTWFFWTFFDKHYKAIYKISDKSIVVERIN